MDSSFCLGTINLGWSVVYIEGVTGYTFQLKLYFSLKNHFVFAISVDPDEMLHYAAVHCLPMYA